MAARKKASKKKTTKKKRAKKATSGRAAAKKKKTTRRKSAARSRKRTAGRKKTTSAARKRMTAPKRTSTKQTAKKKTTKKKVAKKKVAGNKAAKKKTTKKKTVKKKTTRNVAKQAPPKAAVKAVPAPVEEKIAQPSIEEALASLKYKEGHHVVHPKYGLGRVVRLVERTLTLRTVPCLEIHFNHQDMKLTIPVDHVDRSGLRRPISRRDTDGVFKVLRGRATFDAKRRSAKRVADYQKRVRQGDPHSLAEVVRDLSRLSLKKALSYEERKILSEALRILSREVALARGKDPEEVVGEIENIVHR